MAMQHDPSGGGAARGEKLLRILNILAVCTIVVFAAALLLELLPEKQEVPPAEEPSENQQPEQTPPQEETPEETPQDTPEPETEPEPVVKETTAIIGAVGDVLLHDDVIKSGYNSETGTYDYSNIYTWLSSYVSAVDYAAANLEVTLCGDDSGYPYAGYPCFNSPDEIVDAVKAAGFDLLLTANNHANDTGTTGFMRTQEVIADRELDHIGTRQNVEDANYVIRDVNGIKVGMTCYTYSTGYSYAGTFTLNGSALSAQASQLVNAYTYGDLETFYEKLSGEMEQMKAEGAEAIVLFIHWGDEYKTAPNDTQKKMAQRLCDLGVDVIVGNHAHVVQPVELLTSADDETRRTLCLYSTGNSVSNFFETASFPVHTEDGMLFSFTFARYSDGTVLLEGADILPTWVHRYPDENGVGQFRILCMDDGVEDWQSAMELTDEILLECEESYARTMEIVGGGLDEANRWLAQHQTEVEAALGVK